MGWGRFWLGILTAISPCLLATNIAAISFIGRKAGQKNHVIASGLLYSTGRTIAYVLLGVLMAFGSAYVGKAFNRLTHIEIWIRRLAGTAFIVAGLYYCLTHIYGLFV